MAAHLADLGVLDLVSTTSGLALSLSSQAQFASTAEDAASLKLIVEMLATHAIDTAVIGAQSSLDLRLELEIADDESELNAETLTSLFVSRLKRAQLWQQLRLQPSGTSTLGSSDLANHSEAILHLKCLGCSGDQAQGQTHKIPTGPSATSMKFPPGTRKIDMLAVALHFRIHRQSCAKRRKLQKCHSMPIVGHADRPNLRASQSDLHDVTSSLYSVRDPAKAHNSSVAVAPRKGLLSPLTSREPTWSFEANHIRARKRETNCISLSQTRAQDVIQDALEVLGAGFMLAIAPDSKPLPKGISISSKESFKHLAELAPVIWKPDYASALASRSVLLPTLSHALAHVGGSRARSDALKMKVAQIMQPAADAVSISDCSDSEPLSKHRLATRLWQLTQKALLHDTKARQLIPLTRINEVSTNDIVREWDCLEETDRYAFDSDPLQLEIESETSELSLEDELDDLKAIETSLWNDLEHSSDYLDIDDDLDASAIRLQSHCDLAADEMDLFDDDELLDSYHETVGLAASETDHHDLMRKIARIDPMLYSAVGIDEYEHEDMLPI